MNKLSNHNLSFMISNIKYDTSNEDIYNIVDKWNIGLISKIVFSNIYNKLANEYMCSAYVYYSSIFTNSLNIIFFNNIYNNNHIQEINDKDNTWFLSKNEINNKHFIHFNQKNIIIQKINNDIKFSKIISIFEEIFNANQIDFVMIKSEYNKITTQCYIYIDKWNDNELSLNFLKTLSSSENTNNTFEDELQNFLKIEIEINENGIDLIKNNGLLINYNKTHNWYVYKNIFTDYEYGTFKPKCIIKTNYEWYIDSNNNLQKII